MNRIMFTVTLLVMVLSASGQFPWLYGDAYGDAKTIDDIKELIKEVEDSVITELIKDVEDVQEERKDETRTYHSNDEPARSYVTCRRSYRKVGCFVEGKTTMELIINDRVKNTKGVKLLTQASWDNWKEYAHGLACRCAEKARKNGYTYFSIRFWAECWAGKSKEQLANANENRMKDKLNSTECYIAGRTKCSSDPSQYDKECVGRDGTEYMYSLEVNGGWGAWSSYDNCTKTCGGGTQSRTRACDNPPPSRFGADCVGQPAGAGRMSRVCNKQKCPDVFEHKLYTATKSWGDAENECKKWGGHLATVRSQAGNDKFISHLNGKSIIKAWVGYNDKATEGSFKWEGDAGFSDYTNWLTSPHEPNNAGGGEDCVEIIAGVQYSRTYTGKWNDRGCETQNAFFCERHVLEYKLFTDTKTWDDAASKCTKWGGDLATIRSQAQNDVFISHLNGKSIIKGAWVGYNDKAAEGTFKWEGDAGFSDYTNWLTSPHEPNNAGGEDCVEIITGSQYARTYNGKWNDKRCTEQRAFFCQREPNQPRTAKDMIMDARMQVGRPCIPGRKGCRGFTFRDVVKGVADMVERLSENYRQ